jgi:hypothetical protein
MSLQDYTEEQLLQEIERRKRVGNRPTPLREVTEEYDEAFDAMQSLIKLVEGAVDEAIERGYLNEDLCHYVYEAFIQLAYGEAFYEWSNNLPNL